MVSVEETSIKARMGVREVPIMVDTWNLGPLI
jgi:hypothetical protein